MPSTRLCPYRLDFFVLVLISQERSAGLPPRLIEILRGVHSLESQGMTHLC